MDKKLKKIIKQRDSYKCQNPECEGKKKNIPLAIHFIDYNKENQNPQNLITLCLNCKTEAKHNKGYWLSIYKEIALYKYQR